MSQESFEAVRTPLSTPRRTKRGRTLAEAIVVRFPALGPRLLSAARRLPPRSRLRRALLTRQVHRGWAASDRGDLDLALCGIDPEVEVIWPESGTGAIPDLRGVYRGHAGYRQVWQTLHDSLEVDVRPEEMIEAGDMVLVTGQITAHGRGSGIEVSAPLVVLYTMRAGRILREQYFNDRAEALEAAGLRE